MIVMLCIAVLPTIFQTNYARFFWFAVCWCGVVWDLLGKKGKKTHVLVNATRRLRSSAVLIMSQENHSVIRHFCQKSTEQGLRPPRKWLVNVVVCG